jgi:hypothetical protein
MLAWQPTQSPTEDVYYHWFNHVLDEDGEMQGQKDGPSMRPAHWRVGDTVINWFEIPITPDSPEGQFSMRVGMYTIQPGTGTFLGNIPLQDTDGAESLTLELPPAR